TNRFQLTAPYTFTKSAPRKDHRGVNLISDALPFGRLWYSQVSDAIDYGKHSSRAHDAVIRIFVIQISTFGLPILASENVSHRPERQAWCSKQMRRPTVAGRRVDSEAVWLFPLRAGNSQSQC